MGRLEELLLEPMTVPRQLTFTEEIRRLDHVSTNRFEAPLINCYVHLPRMMQQKNSECKQPDIIRIPQIPYHPMTYLVGRLECLKRPEIF